MTDENIENSDATGPSVPPPPPLPPLSAADAAAAMPVLPSVPPPPPHPAASQRPAWFTGRSILHAALAGAIGVGFALAASVLVLVLTIVGFLVSGGGGGSDPLSDLGVGIETDGLGFLAGVIWLAALGLSGQLGASVAGAAAGQGGGAEGTIFFVPVLVFVAGVMGTAWWAYRSERAQRTSSRAGLWVLALVSGVVAAVLLLLLSVIGRVTTSTSFFGGEVSATIWTLTLGTLFGPLVVVLLASVFGRWLARGAVSHRTFGHALWYAPSRFRWGTRDVWDYVVVLTIVFAVTSLIAALVLGDGALGAWPMALGQAMIAAASIAHFGAIGASAGGPQTSTMFLSYVSSDAPGSIWLLLLAALVSTLITAVLIARRRLHGQPPLQEIWRLPVFTAAIAIVLGVTLGSIYAVGGLNTGFAGDVAFGAAFYPAPWTYVLVLFWALLVEVLARFVAPALVGTFPFAARLKVAGDAPAPRVAAAWAYAPAPSDTQPTTPYPAAGFPVGAGTAPVPYPDAPVAPGVVTGAYPGAPVAPGAVPGAAAAPVAGSIPPPQPLSSPPAQPLSPAAKKRIILFSIIAGAVIVLAVAAVITISTLRSTVYSASATAQRYVDAVAEGRFSDAQALEGRAAENEPLLTADSIEMLAGMEDVEVTAGSGLNSQALVRYTVDGEQASHVIALRSTGKEFLFFDTWEVTDGLLGEATVWARDLETITVGGVEIPLDEQGEASFAAYPGLYEVSAPGSEWMQATAEPLMMSYGYGVTQVETSPTPALTDEVERQVRALIDECAAGGELDAEGCPFRAWSYGETRDVTWTIEEYPTIDVSDDGSWIDSPDTGSATATWEEQDYSGEWAAETYTDDFYIWGEVEVDGDDVTITVD